MHILYYYYLQDRQYLYWTLKRNMDSEYSDVPTMTKIIPSMHHCWSSVLLNWKHLQDRVVTKPDPEPTSVTNTPNVSYKDHNHMHAQQKPYMLHAPAAPPPKLVAQQYITPNEKPQTPAKPVNTQCNQSSVQSSTEPKVPAPPCVPAARFLLALLVIPKWQHANQVTPDMHQNT